MVTKIKATFPGQRQWERLQQAIPIAPLITFRITFGLMMLAGILRFWLKGWITELYVKPTFYFTYWGFEWVRPLGSVGMHGLFALTALASLLITVGLFYRVATLLFFVIFTYVELIDITNYLNHYYFISLISFLLIFLPANRYFSLDVRRNPHLKQALIPRWMVGILRLQVSIVYFFAGLAKLNSDWLLQALPMKIWLPAKSHLPLVGPWMYERWIAYGFSWFGAAYDLLIAFFLLYRKTRPVAYVFVLGFHLATALFFPGIGLFPYVMILSSLVFFSAGFHEKLLAVFHYPATPTSVPSGKSFTFAPLARRLTLLGIVAYFLFQLLLPIRFLLYPGHLFWNEDGYRFSWRVMLMEKSGNAFFSVKEPATGRTYEVDNREFLTPLQEKMMSTQPDMMLRYTHYLAKVYAQRGIRQPEVYAESYVALNGRRSRLFVDSTVNLAAQSLSWRQYTWVVPYPANSF